MKKWELLILQTHSRDPLVMLSFSSMPITFTEIMIPLTLHKA